MGLYDPQTGKWETVFDSTIKADNPFSAGNTYEVCDLSTAGDRLFFYIGFGSLPQQQWGLWQMDTKTRALKHLCTFYSARVLHVADEWWLAGDQFFARLYPSLGKADNVLMALTSVSGKPSGSGWPMEDKQIMTGSFPGDVWGSPFWGPGRS